MNKRLPSTVCLCALVAAVAACGPGPLTSDRAQALLNEQLPPGMVEVLDVRQVSSQEAIARVRVAGVEAGDFDVTFALLDTGWLPDGVTIEGKPFPLTDLLVAADRDRQQRTMASMRDLAGANHTMRVDTGRYAANLAELGERGYMENFSPHDAWGNPWMYLTGRSSDTYTIASMGSDGGAGPAPPMVWMDEPYDPDIILTDGQFTQAPTGR